jgi:iron complex transport system ATP-binding protein
MRLEAREITAGYDRSKDVLDAVSVAVETGQFVGLLGPNGSGKSTLLRVLTRVLPPRLGKVWLDGKEVERWTTLEIARRVAFVPQQESAAFDFTVREIVLMGRYPHRARFRGETAEDYALVAQALEETDALHLQDRPVTELSGGEHRRVLLARALAQQTPLLLLDEPTAHLDVTHQVALLSKVQTLCHEEGKGALAALHDLNQAAEFCDRLVLLCRGKVVAEGTPEEVLTPDNLRRAYDAEACIGPNPITGRPMILTLHPIRENTETKS